MNSSPYIQICGEENHFIDETRQDFGPYMSSTQSTFRDLAVEIVQDSSDQIITLFSTKKSRSYLRSSRVVMQDPQPVVILKTTRKKKSWKCGSNHAKSWRSAPSFQDAHYFITKWILVTSTH